MSSTIPWDKPFSAVRYSNLILEISTAKAEDRQIKVISRIIDLFIAVPFRK
jgi:hypothetical protein